MSASGGEAALSRCVPKAWTLLRYLVDRPGALVTKDELHTAIWSDVVISDDTLTHTMRTWALRLTARRLL